MPCAREIAANLLESDPDSIEPEHYFDQLVSDEATGVVNGLTARTANRFYHRTLTYKGGKTPIEVRRNGATKYWKREPTKFRVPVKYGLRDCFYIDNQNAHEWSTKPLPPKTSA